MKKLLPILMILLARRRRTTAAFTRLYGAWNEIDA